MAVQGNEGVSYGSAIEICEHLDDATVSDAVKGLAIYKIMTMATINAVTKKTLMKIIRYLWPFVFQFASDLELVGELDDTDRGDKGFGSTGR